MRRQLWVLGLATVIGFGCDVRDDQPAGTGSSSAAVCSDVDHFRVVTANLVHYDPGVLSGIQLENATALAEAQVDYLYDKWDPDSGILYALQEVDRYGNEVNWPDGELWDSALAEAFEPTGGWCGKSLYQEYQINCERHHFDYRPYAEPAATIGTVAMGDIAADSSEPVWELGDGCESPSGTWTRNAALVKLTNLPFDAWLASIHLNPQPGEPSSGDPNKTVSECEMENLADHLADLPWDDVVILTGDFNATDESDNPYFDDLLEVMASYGLSRLVSDGAKLHVFVRATSLQIAGVPSVERAEGYVSGPDEVLELSDHKVITTDFEIMSSAPEALTTQLAVLL